MVVQALSVTDVVKYIHDHVRMVILYLGIQYMGVEQKFQHQYPLCSVLFILVSVNLIIMVCYILKDRNHGEYFSPGFVKMDFQRSLVQVSKNT